MYVVLCQTKENKVTPRSKWYNPTMHFEFQCFLSHLYNCSFYCVSFSSQKWKWLPQNKKNSIILLMVLNTFLRTSNHCHRRKKNYFYSFRFDITNIPIAKIDQYLAIIIDFSGQTNETDLGEVCNFICHVIGSIQWPR